MSDENEIAGLKRRIERLEKLSGIREKSETSKLVCPNGHSEKFEVLGYVTYTSAPPTHAANYKCLTCGVAFEVRGREPIESRIIDYTKQDDQK